MEYGGDILSDGFRKGRDYRFATVMRSYACLQGAQLKPLFFPPAPSANVWGRRAEVSPSNDILS